MMRTNRCVFRYTYQTPEEGGTFVNLEDQYDKIYRYLYFHLHDRHLSEDLTQEVFLRFLGSRTYREENRQLQYLYTIARNLCSQHYREKNITYSVDEMMDAPVEDGFESSVLQQLALREAFQKLSQEEREMLILRYINDVPVSVMSGLYRISRYAVYRKIRGSLTKLRIELEKEEKDG